MLLWKDEGHCLRIEWGSMGPREISFLGCMEKRETLFGRGRLPSVRPFLRLERNGVWIEALCSEDGEHWFSLGQARFALTGPIQVGLYAIGMIDRTIYPGAHRAGTAIRFEEFALWETGTDRVAAIETIWHSD
jgi:hypothetical protein